MDAWSMIWWISMLITTGVFSMWYLMAQQPGSRRLCLSLLVFLIAGHLLVGHNKLWVGDQSLNVQVNQQDAEAGTYQLTFRDVAGRPMSIDMALPSGKAVVDEVVERLTALDSEGNSKLELAGEPTPTPDRLGIVLTVADHTGSPNIVADILTVKPVSQPNPTKPLFNINQGIDLRGGVEFTCRLYDKTNTVVPADEEVINILRRRLDARGLTEPQVFRMTNGDVQVVIPGGTQADAARTRSVWNQQAVSIFVKLSECFLVSLVIT